MADKQLITFKNEPTLPYAIEEAVNRLRINISFLGNDIRKIMFISSEPNEGKSFVCMNLWKQMVQTGVKTILLDADMRKSEMIDAYGIEREDGEEIKGTSHYLSEEGDIEDYILHKDGDNGDILPNVDNVVNPSMLLESKKFEDMLDYMAEKYRYVFVDAPPLSLVSDGERIGNLCDGAVIVVRSGVTPKGIIRSSIGQLERAGCPVLGIVLNRVDTTSGGYYNKYYHGSKYYYNSEYYSK